MKKTQERNSDFVNATTRKRLAKKSQNRRKRRLRKMVAKKMVENELKRRHVENKINDGAASGDDNSTKPILLEQCTGIEYTEEQLNAEEQLEISSDVSQDSELQGHVHRFSILDSSEIVLDCIKPPSPCYDSSDMLTEEYQDVTSDSSEVLDIDSTHSDWELDDVTEEVILPAVVNNRPEDSNDSYSVALLSMVCKHNMTDSCTADMLKLFAQMLPEPNPLPPSLFLLLNKFVSYDQETVLHRCCGFCNTLLPMDTSCQATECLSAGVQESSFIEIRLDKQLQTLFSGSKYMFVYRHPHRQCIIFESSYKCLHSLVL